MRRKLRRQQANASSYDQARQGDRFLQTDPIGSEDDLNLYAYTGGDPINKTDPSGESSTQCFVDTRDAASSYCGETVNDGTFTNYVTINRIESYGSTSYESTVKISGFTAPWKLPGAILDALGDKVESITGEKIDFYDPVTERSLVDDILHASNWTLGTGKTEKNDRIKCRSAAGLKKK